MFPSWLDVQQEGFIPTTVKISLDNWRNVDMYEYGQQANMMVGPIIKMSYGVHMAPLILRATCGDEEHGKSGQDLANSWYVGQVSRHWLSKDQDLQLANAYMHGSTNMHGSCNNGNGNGNWNRDLDLILILTT